MKDIIRTDKAPAALGPYSQAVRTGDFIFLSGQIAINAASSKIEHDDIAGQTRQVLENLKAVLEETGAGLEDVVKTTVFLSSMKDFQAMNEVYAEYFDKNPPARATIEVAGLPLGARVEIEAIARR
jgi:2-iminobutanoate/2-iminopropanoate deaminase